MRRCIPIVLLLLALAGSAFAQNDIRFQNRNVRISTIRATVLNVTRLGFPNARVTLRINDFRTAGVLEGRRRTREITATNYLVTDRNLLNLFSSSNQVDWRNKQNINSIAAYYLLPGDEISAKVFLDPSQRDRWYIYGISREGSNVYPWPGGGPPMFRDLRLSLDTDRETYSQDRTVNMTLAVTNTGNDTQRIDLRDAQQYDFVVSRNGREVWRWSRDKVFAQPLTTITLRPGQTMTFREQWDQMDNNGRRVSAGEYEIGAMLNVNDSRKLNAQPTTIEITRAGGGSQSYEDLRLSLDTDRETYSQDRTVNMTLTVRNTGNDTQRIDLRDAQQYDFVVSRNGREVWRWSRDRAFAQALTTITLRPGQTMTFREQWDQMDSSGRRVSAGEYEIGAMLNVNDRQKLDAEPITIEIQRD